MFIVVCEGEYTVDWPFFFEEHLHATKNRLCVLRTLRKHYVVKVSPFAW